MTKLSKSHHAYEWQFVFCGQLQANVCRTPKHTGRPPMHCTCTDAKVWRMFAGPTHDGRTPTTTALMPTGPTHTGRDPKHIRRTTVCPVCTLAWRNPTHTGRTPDEPGGAGVGVGVGVDVGAGVGVGVGVGGPLQIFVDCEMVASFPPLHWYFNHSFLSSTWIIIIVIDKVGLLPKALFFLKAANKTKPNQTNSQMNFALQQLWSLVNKPDILIIWTFWHFEWPARIWLGVILQLSFPSHNSFTFLRWSLSSLWLWSYKNYCYNVITGLDLSFFPKKSFPLKGQFCSQKWKTYSSYELKSSWLPN